MNKQLVGPDGQPISTARLEEDVDLGGLTSIRQVWHPMVGRGLTPAQLANILERAAQGDAQDYLTLAEEMEEHNAHLVAVLSVRRRAVAGLPRIVEAASTSAEHVEHAELVRAVLKRPATHELVNDLLDGIFKGYSVCAIKWQRSKQWLPISYPHMDPRWFVYDQETGRKLLIRSTEHPNGGELDPFTYIVHQPRIKTGLQIRAGLARIVAFLDLLKSYGQKDWMAYVEVFGMPLRIGRFGPNATPEDKAILRRALASIGTDAAAMLSESLKLEFHEVKNVGNGAEVYEKLCEFVDKQISKAVLGQTMTTDAQSAGLGSGQAQVQNEIRGDILDADAFDIETTLNRDLVRPLIDLNFGPQDAYPRVVLQIAEPEDLKLLSESIPAMVQVGMRVPEAWAREKFGVPEPAGDERLLGSAAPAPMPLPPALNRRTALNAYQRPSIDVVDLQIDRVGRESDTAMRAWRATVEQLLGEVQTLQEFRDRLLELYAHLPADALAELIADSMTAAELAGRHDILVEAGQT